MTMLEGRNGHNAPNFTTNGRGETSRRPDGLVVPEFWKLRVPYDLRHADHSLTRFFTDQGYKFRVDLETQSRRDNPDMVVSQIIPLNSSTLEVFSTARRTTNMGNPVIRGVRQAFDGFDPKFREGDAEPYFLDRIMNFAKYRKTNGAEGEDLPWDMVDFIIHPHLEEFMKKVPEPLKPPAKLSQRVKSEIQGLEADPRKLAQEYPESRLPKFAPYRYSTSHPRSGNGHPQS